MTEWEDQIGEYSNTVITLVEGGEPEALRGYISRLERNEVDAVMVSLAVGLLKQEQANVALTDRNAVLEGGNIALFRERRELLDRLEEHRQINQQRAAASTAKRGRRDAA